MAIVAFGACEAKQEQKEETITEDKTEENTMGENEKTEAKKIIFFGNSITAGYQLDPADAFPNLIQL